MENQTFTFAEAGQKLRVTPDTLHNWRRAGRLIASQTPGGQYRIPATEIERLSKTTDQGDKDGQS